MCGIVGYIGNKEAVDYLMNGLHRLEYRGYDSSGVATISQDGSVNLVRAKGKVSELESKLDDARSDGFLGIGHTRWATHGEPSEQNAHPHHVGDIYLVHNGIIENYKDIKEKLKDYKFNSATDTEVLAALIDFFYDKDTKLVDAVTQALKLVVGTYGIAVISPREPDKMVVARSGSPLIIGVGEGTAYVASDASALVGYTDQAIYLNDGEIAVCMANGVRMRNLAAEPITSKIEKIEVDIQAIQKQGYDHFLLKEICEQPQTLMSTISGRVNPDEGTVRLGGLNLTDEELRKIEHVVIVGCGTAYYAGLLGSYYLEQLVDGLTVEVAAASELRYRSFHLPKNTIALIVSQSGETADTLACLREIKRRNIKTLGIVNVVGSTIAREVDGGTYLHAGPEISVASTKAFTSQVTAIVMFGVQLAQTRGESFQVLSQFVKEIAALPDEISLVIKDSKEKVSKLAKKYSKYEHAFYFGRDTLYPTAMEGALKLKEISYIQAEGYAGGELKHGPIALVDDRFFEVALVLDNWLLEKSISNIAEVNARSGHIIVITNSDKHIDAEQVIRVKTKLNVLAPIVLNVIQQLFAYYVSVDRGNDVDQPRNLAKSVTVE